MATLTVGIATRPYGSRNMAFVVNLAKAAIEKGHKVKIWCTGDANSVLKKNQHKYKGMFYYEGDLKELLENGAEIVACESCAEMRGVREEDLIEGVSEQTMPWFIEAAVTSEASLMIGEE